MGLFEVMARIALDTSAYEKGLGEASKKTQSFGGNLNTALGKVGTAVKTGMKAASAAAVALGVSSVKTGMDFDAAMSKVGAISGATGEDFDALRKKAQEMGEKTQFSATESANAFEYMAMAGWKTNDMIDGIAGIMNLAAASGEDLATTSDIVTDALTAFGLQSKDSGHFADLLAVASSNANTNVSMMGETFKYVAPVAGSLGVSAEDTAEAIGLMANAGIKSSQAGTTLRSIMTRLSTDAGASSKSLGALGTLTQGLGVDFYDSKGKVRDFGKILSEARKQWKNLSSEDASRFAKKIAGQEGISGWLALMNAAPKDIKKLQKAIEECDGAAEEMANTRLDNLSGDITKMKSAFEGLQIAISDKLSPAFRKFVQAGTKGLTELTTAVKSGDLGNVFNVIADGVSKAAKKMETAGAEIMNSIIAGIEKHSKQVANNVLYLVASWAISLREKASDFVDSGIKFAESIADGLDKSTSIFAKAIPTIVKNIAGIFSDNVPKIVESLTNGIQKHYPKLIKTAWNAAVKLSDGLRKGASNLVDAGLKLIMALADGLIKNIPTLIKTVPTIISNLAGIINDNAPKLLTAGATLIAKLGKGIVDAWPTIKEEFPKIIKSIIDVWSAVSWLNLGTQAVTAIKNGVTTIGPKVVNGLKDVGTKAINAFKSVNWQAVGSNVITTLKSAITTAGSGIVTVLKTVGTKAIAAFKSVDWAAVGKAAINFIKTAASTAGSAIVNLLKTIGTKAIAAFKGVDWKSVGKAAIEFIKNAASGAGHLIVTVLKTIGKNAINAFKSVDWAAVGKAAINLIKNAITGAGKLIVNVLKTIGQNGINAFKSVDWAAVGKSVINFIGNAIRGAFNIVKTALTYVGNQAKSAFSSIDWGELGRNVVRGIAVGISGLAREAYDAAKNMAQGVLNRIARTFDENSPSKETEKQAKYLVEGIVIGINKNKKNAEKSAQELGELVLQASEQRLKNYKVYHGESLELEVAFWNAVRKETQKGTQARIDADAKYKETLKSYREEVKKTITDAQNLATSFSQSFSEINDNLEKSIAETKQKYKDALEQRANGLASSIKIFEQFQKADLPKYTEIVGIDENGEKITREVTANSDILINNLKAQVDAIHEWNSVLGSLTNKLGGNNPLLKQFESMGTDSYETLKLINDMTDEQLNTYVDLYNQYASEAMTRAKEENKSLKAQTETHVARLKEDAKQKLKTLKDQYAKDLAELAKNSKSNGEKVGSSISKGVSKGIKNAASEVKDAAKTITQKVLNIKPDAKISGEAVGESMARGAANSVKNNSNKVIEAVRTITGRVKESSSEAKSSGKSIGEYIAQGIEKGIKDGESSIKAVARQAARGAYNSAKNELDINSPSKKFAWIGKMIDNGLALGINKNTDSVDNAISNLSNITQFPNPSNWSTATATVSGNTAGNNVTTITMNIYGAQGQDVKALADEVERRLNAKVTRGGVAFA